MYRLDQKSEFQFPQSGCRFMKKDYYNVMGDTVPDVGNTCIKMIIFIQLFYTSAHIIRKYALR